MVGANTIGHRVVRKLQTVAQHRVHHRTHVIRGDEVLPCQPGMGPGHPVQADAATRAGADLDPARQVRVMLSGVACGIDQVDQVTVERRRYLYASNSAARREHHLLGQALRRLMRAAGLLFFVAHQAQHLGLVLDFGIVQLQFHQKPVHLRLGQRVRALLLDRVLGCQHHEQPGHRVALPGHGDLAFFHGLQQCSLDLGRCAVDFVGKNHVAEQRPGLKLDFVALRGLLQNLATGDVRWQQVGGELDAPHAGFQMRGQGLDRARLGQPRQALQQYVTVGQQAEDHMADGICLAQYALRHTGFKRCYLLTYIH
ncbi:hypothetical protein D3C73_1062600 [compost metagenome]